MMGLARGARGAQMAMGVLLLLSGGLKIWEPVLFYWQAVPYTQLLGITSYWPLVARAALAAAPYECLLGMALLANWRPRVIMPLAIILMVFFIGLTVAAWKVGATEECGCFGSLVDRSPGQAAVEDVVMLCLLAWGWWGSGRNRGWPRGGRWVLVATLLAVAVGTARFVPEMDRLEHSDLLPGVRLRGLEVKGVSADLQTGRWLVELFSPRCGHCLAAVPKVNLWSLEPELPPVVALTSFALDSAAMEKFNERTAPAYLVGSISKTDFFRLTWKHRYPRLAYVRDGIVRQVWESGHFPSLETLRAAVTED